MVNERRLRVSEPRGLEMQAHGSKKFHSQQGQSGWFLRMSNVPRHHGAFSFLLTRKGERRGGEGREGKGEEGRGGEALYKGCLSVRLPSTALIKEQGEKQQFSSASGSTFPVISLGREMLFNPHQGLLVLLFVCLFF